MTRTTLTFPTKKAYESGCFPRVLVGEALRNVARQCGLTVFPGESDTDLGLRVMEVTNPTVGVHSQYP
ncbi:MAG: hypothetical protein M3Z05_21905 [Gemmatimonadota bacterium]|nr:hypothetical protein [Gemmatimonadota bacterium]